MNHFCINCNRGAWDFLKFILWTARARTLVSRHAAVPCRQKTSREVRKVREVLKISLRSLRSLRLKFLRRTSSATRKDFRLHRRGLAGRSGFGGRGLPRAGRSDGFFCERGCWRLPPQALPSRQSLCELLTPNSSLLTNLALPP